jgi:hypothetical protein
MADCLVPGCSRAAVIGEDWQGGGLVPVTAYRRGLELCLTVKDTAVTLALRDEHAVELGDAGWDRILAVLDAWGWRPRQDPRCRSFAGADAGPGSAYPR